jgi:hypothetical protein
MEVGKRCGREDINPSEQMVCRHTFIKIEFVEQSTLIRRLPPHHDTAPDHRPLPTKMNHGSPKVSNGFFNGIRCYSP